MKTACILLLLGCLLIVACQQENQFDAAVIIDPALTKSPNDTLYTYRGTQKCNYFEEQKGYSKLDNDTIFIRFSIGRPFTVNPMTISLFKGDFALKLFEHSCTYSRSYHTIAQQLVLNKKQFALNDTIVGEVYAKTVCVIDSAENIIDTLVVKGKFSFRVREAQFNYTIKDEEDRHQEILAMSKSRPDTITALYLSYAGYKNIPAEILLFKNLKILHFNGNDLSNADLSMLSSLTKLEDIELDGCNLSEFPAALFKLKKLKEVSVCGNQIKALPAGLFDMTSLTTLYMGGNDFDQLPEGIGKLHHLENLSIAGTSVRTLPTSIFRLKKLREISVPDSMDYFPPSLAKYLDPHSSYDGIKNIGEFRQYLPTAD